MEKEKAVVQNKPTKARGKKKISVVEETAKAVEVVKKAATKAETLLDKLNRN